MPSARSAVHGAFGVEGPSADTRYRHRAPHNESAGGCVHVDQGPALFDHGVRLGPGFDFKAARGSILSGVLQGGLPEAVQVSGLVHLCPVAEGPSKELTSFFHGADFTRWRRGFPTGEAARARTIQFLVSVLTIAKSCPQFWTCSLQQSAKGSPLRIPVRRRTIGSSS